MSETPAELPWPANLDSMGYKDDPELSVEDNLYKHKFHLSMLKFWLGLQYASKVSLMDEDKAQETIQHLNRYTKEIEEKIKKL
jgi:hypothetical protein